MEFANTYKEVKSGYQFTFRKQAREMALTLLSLKDSIMPMEFLLDKPRVQFLYFHHVFKDETSKLEMLLEFLAKNHTFISYSKAVNLILEGKIDKPYISFSSDDGFKNNMLAAKVLAAYGAMACFFINPCIIGETDFNKVKTYCRQKLGFPPVEFLNWEEVDELMKMGHEIGSHSMCHNNLSSLSESQLVEDIESSFRVIKAHCGVSKHFAFPYGNFKNFTEQGRKFVFQAGYESCATAQRGCHINPDSFLARENFSLKRDHIILDWNINHIRHFILNNSKMASANDNLAHYQN